MTLKCKRGLQKTGLIPFLSKWGVLRDHQKMEIAITTAAVAGIALGSVLMITAGLFTKEEEEQLAGKNNNNRQR